MSRDDVSGRPRVDEVIDAVVAGMTGGTPRPDLCRRVVDGIEAGRRSGRFAAARVSRWRLAAVGAAVAGIVLTVWTMSRLDRSVSPTNAERVRVSSQVGDGASRGVEGKPSVEARVPADAQSRYSEVVTPPGESARVGSARRARAAATAASQAPPMLEPVDVEPLDASGPLPLAALARRLEPLNPEAIHVEPLTLDPLAERLPSPLTDGQATAPVRR
jgi:hypothetical protein